VVASHIGKWITIHGCGRHPCGWVYGFCGHGLELPPSGNAKLSRRKKKIARVVESTILVQTTNRDGLIRWECYQRGSKTYLKMSSFQKQHCWCYKGLDGGCSREPLAAFVQNDLGPLERTVTDAAGADCGSEYVVTDNDWKELVEVPGIDEASRVDVAAESRQSVGAEDAAVAVVGLAVLDGDDAGK
jgi:hypothetical protein